MLLSPRQKKKRRSKERTVCIYKHRHLSKIEQHLTGRINLRWTYSQALPP